MDRHGESRSVSGLNDAYDKGSIERICIGAFDFGDSPKNANLVTLTCRTLCIEKEVSMKILQSLQNLTKYVIDKNMNDAILIEKLFPGDFQNKFKKFLSNANVKNVTLWNEKLSGNSAKHSCPCQHVFCSYRSKNPQWIKSYIERYNGGNDKELKQN